MKKNIFEETYKGIQEAKRAYDAAVTKEEKEAASILYMTAQKNLVGLTKAESMIWRAYETSMDCGNKHIDFNEPISDETVEDLIACMRDYGIEAFTYSSTWSSAVETAWLFQKTGCTPTGLIEINSPYKAFMSDEYEKAHGYLFKLN